MGGLGEFLGGGGEGGFGDFVGVGTEGEGLLGAGGRVGGLSAGWWHFGDGMVGVAGVGVLLWWCVSKTDNSILDMTHHRYASVGRGDTRQKREALMELSRLGFLGHLTVVVSMM